MKADILFWAVIVSSVISETSTTLKGGINAVCTIPVSYRRSRIRTYLEEYREDEGSSFSPMKVRTKFETTYYTAWVEKQICCPGYEKKNGTCETLCSPPCEIGHCEQPNTCVLPSANVSLYFESSRLTRSVDNLNSTKNCTAGNCTAAEDQQYPCEDGYQKDTGHECVPICKLPCNNGTCTAPNNCSCGFRYNSTTMDCDPVCTETCVNGTCQSPETCVCLKDCGKSSMNSSTCDTACKNCTNGTCKALGECVCDELGFVSDKMDEKSNATSCQPECNNGVCYFRREGDLCGEPRLCFVSNASQDVNVTTESNLPKSNVSDTITEKSRTELQLPACRPECIDQLGSTTVNSTQNTTDGIYHFIPIDSSCNIGAPDFNPSNEYRTVFGTVLGIIVFGMIVCVAYYVTRKLAMKKRLMRSESMQCLYTGYMELNSNEGD